MNPQEFGAHRKSLATSAGEISYADIGTGPAALLVHGVFLNAYFWRHVIRRVSIHRRCIAVDLLGHGHTAAQPGTDLSFDAQADMLVEVCDALDLRQVDLVGNDSGGGIAQIFAAHHSERLRSLTLTNCDVHDNWPPRAFAPVCELARQGALGLVAREMLDNLELARSDFGLGAGYENPQGLDANTVAAYLEPLFRDDESARALEAFINAWDPAQTISIEPRLRSLEVPTLIIWGTADVFFDVSWAHWLAETIPGARAPILLDGARLFFPEERPDELSAALLRHWTDSAEEARVVPAWERNPRAPSPTGDR